MGKLTHALTQIQIDIDLINSFKFLQKALFFPLGAGTFGMFYIYIDTLVKYLSFYPSNYMQADLRGDKKWISAPQSEDERVGAGKIAMGCKIVLCEWSEMINIPKNLPGRLDIGISLILSVSNNVTVLNANVLI